MCVCVMHELIESVANMWSQLFGFGLIVAFSAAASLLHLFRLYFVEENVAFFIFLASCCCCL